jgi:hypothetical protein
MTKTTGLAKGLSGNCKASELRVGDVIVVTRGRSYSRQRVTITAAAGMTGAPHLIRLDYVTAKGETGWLPVDVDERWTRISA